MDLMTGLAIGVGLCLALWVPYFIMNTRRGKARGHSDIGPDVGFRQTRPGGDEARGARY